MKLLIIFLSILFNISCYKELVRTVPEEIDNNKLEGLKKENKGVLLIRLELKEGDDTWKPTGMTVNLYKYLPIQIQSMGATFIGPIPIFTNSLADPKPDFTDIIHMFPETKKVYKLDARKYYYKIDSRVDRPVISNKFYLYGGYIPHENSKSNTDDYIGTECVPIEKWRDYYQCPTFKIFPGEITEIIIKPSKPIKESFFHRFLTYSVGLLMFGLGPFVGKPYSEYYREYEFEIRNPVVTR